MAKSASSSAAILRRRKPSGDGIRTAWTGRERIDPGNKIAYASRPVTSWGRGDPPVLIEESEPLLEWGSWTIPDPRLSSRGNMGPSTPGAVPKDDGCRSLWQSVLMQSLYDACVLPHNQVQSRGRAQAALDVAHRQAVAWFNPGRRDFVDVCVMAGLHPERVLDCFHRFQKDPDEARNLINAYLVARSHTTLEAARRDHADLDV